MATMLSSPIGPAHGTSRYDPFDPPSSPTRKHDELPAEFGDQSFGSSMSLGSSFEISRLAPSGSSSSHLAHLASNNNTRKLEDPQATIRMTRRSPPRSGQESLGAAMGTVLNSRSPGLAAKMNSSDYMDMSASLSSPPLLAATPSKGSEEDSALLPPGSAMKEDTPVRPPFVSRRSSSETSATAGSSLGRLFGTELSLNARHRSLQCNLTEESLAAQESPDKEPPLKRRPSSMPHAQGGPPVRPSLRSVGMGPPASAASAASRRPNLLKSMTTGQAAECRPSSGRTSRRNSQESGTTLSRASDSVVPTVGTMKSYGASSVRRSRPGSAGSNDGRDVSQLQRPGFPLPSLHPTIIESPSPSTVVRDDFGSYFFDPQSPELTRTAAPSSITSKLAAQGDHLSRPRIFTKATTSVVVPSMATAGGSSSSSLGKRMNPYAKKSAASNALPAFQLGKQTTFGAAASTTNAPPSSRMTAPAPRRCQSAVDNSAAFVQAEDLSMNSIDGANDSSVLLSPSDNRGSMSTRIFPPDFDASGSPIAPSARPKMRPGLFRKSSKDDSSPLGYGTGKRFMTGNVDGLSPYTACNEAGPSGSPYRGAEGMPGFGASEREGKILPGFNVKDDGLMRITPATLRQVLSGQFDNRMEDYQIVDCRFGYEFEGGHISGAINLSTMERVKAYFLQPDGGRRLPVRSQSGKPDAHGQLRKKVLIFHCEFSAKRAPSMALALRQADRALAQDYPNCHYPEIYILQGGYCGFFREHAEVCEPRCYVQMDDPKFQDKRSVELNGFRKQFSRHRSFTYGDSGNTARLPHSDGSLLQHRPAFGGRPIHEEESSSFEDSASPSAVQANSALARQKASKGHMENFKSFGPILASAPATAIGDLSFTSSVGDSSFEGGPSESPCAAAASNSRRPSHTLVSSRRGNFGQAQGQPAIGTGGSLGRHSFQRAATATHIQLR